MNSSYLAFYTASTETAGNDNAVNVFKYGIKIDIITFQRFRVDPVNINFGFISNARMAQGFSNAQIGIVQGYIFTDQGNFQFFFRMINIIDHLFPVFHITRLIF